MSREHVLWVEKYRPDNISECILTESLRDIFQAIIDNGEIPNLLLYGNSGSGKTTVAKALCKELSCDYILINGSLGAEESGIEAMRTTLKQFASTVSFTGNRKVVIIDEADYLNPNSSQPALRGLMEEFAKNCAFIFTCNYKDKILPAIHSRCSAIEFKVDKKDKPKIAMKFLKRILFILDSEGVQYDDKRIIAEFVMRYFPDTRPDFRRAINELQKFVAKDKKIDERILARNLDNNLNFDGLYKALKEKNFPDVRKWVVDSLSEDQSKIWRKIYDSLYVRLKPQSVPPLVVLIAQYQYWSAFTPDPEPNLVAFLTEIMISDVEFI